MPEGGLDTPANGSAVSSEGTKTNQLAATAAYGYFQPNVGAICRDPNSGKTHLLAIQLRGTSGSQVKWQSLGTGWEGSTAIAMDRDYFFIVWKNAVYKVPQRTPDA